MSRETPHAAVPPIIPARLREASGCGGRKAALRWWVLGIFPAGAVGWVFYRFNPSQYNFYPRCLFNAATGWLCPGCGSQRALYQLVHGHLLTACRCNLLLMLALAWLAVQGARAGLASWRGTPVPAWLPPASWYKWIGTGAILFAVLRNLPGAPFGCLAPP